MLDAPIVVAEAVVRGYQITFQNENMVNVPVFPDFKFREAQPGSVGKNLLMCPELLPAH